MADIPKNFTIIVPRVINRLDSMRETIVDFLNKHHISEGCVSRIELSIYEAVVNIIEHSSPRYNDKEIQIECAVQDHDVLITVSHYGERFDITKAELPDIENHYKSGKMRGLGIYFIMTLMDKVEYSHHDMISTLKMIKNI